MGIKPEHQSTNLKAGQKTETNMKITWQLNKSGLPSIVTSHGAMKDGDCCPINTLLLTPYKSQLEVTDNIWRVD